MMNWLKRLLGIENRGYVIVYDRLDEPSGDTYEEYYGYFSSPEEARTVWSTYVGTMDISNIKLCRIVEDW